MKTQQPLPSELNCRGVTFIVAKLLLHKRQTKATSADRQSPATNREKEGTMKEANQSRGGEENKRQKFFGLFCFVFAFLVFLPSWSAAVINYSGCEPEGEKHG